MVRRNTIEVRCASASDEVAWRRLWQAYCDFYSVVIPIEVTDALWDRITDPAAPVKALVAEVPTGATDNNGVAGFANYVLHPYTWGTGQVCYLEDLFVSEPMRGAGCGSALIASLISRAEKNGWSRLYWHTHELNEPARSVYDKFTRVDPFVRYVVKTG
jgi:GNAT superfamily N-acetyltransferase